MSKLSIHEWIKRCNKYQEEIKRLQKQCLDFQERYMETLAINKLLEECVEFYAKHENHDFDNNDYHDDMELVEYYEVYDKASNAFLTIDPEDKRRVGDDIEVYEDYMIGKRARKCLEKLKQMRGSNE